jgi:hypothetical protein
LVFVVEKARVFGSIAPRVPACQYWTPPALESSLMWVKLASRLRAKPPSPVVRAAWNAVGAMAIPSSLIMLAHATLFGRHANWFGVAPAGKGGAKAKLGFWAIC